MPSPWTRLTWRPRRAGRAWSRPHVSTVKIGLELYLRYGPEVVTVDPRCQRRRGLPRPEAARHPGHRRRRGPRGGPAAARRILTVHAAAGPAAIRAAVQAAPDTQIAAVTVLTSLGEDDLAADRHGRPVRDAVRRLAVLSVAAGAPGLVCSPREVAGRPGRGRAGHHAHHPGDPASRVGRPGSGESLDARGGPERGGRPSGHRQARLPALPDPGAAAAAIGASLRRLAAPAG